MCCMSYFAAHEQLTALYYSFSLSMNTSSICHIGRAVGFFDNSKLILAQFAELSQLVQIAQNKYYYGYLYTCKE